MKAVESRRSKIFNPLIAKEVEQSPDQEIQTDKETRSHQGTSEKHTMGSL